MKLHHVFKRTNINGNIESNRKQLKAIEGNVMLLEVKEHNHIQLFSIAFYCFQLHRIYFSLIKKIAVSFLLPILIKCCIFDCHN